MKNVAVEKIQLRENFKNNEVSYLFAHCMDGTAA